MKRHGSMNHIYRLVWSTVTNGWIAVAETTRGRGKGGRRKLVAAALSLTAIAAQAAPTGGQIVAGSGSIRQSGATTTISQTSQNATLNWSGFNIAPQETVNFVQPSVSAIAVNRIFDTNGTQILGHLNANGQAFLINPNGILFGSGAQVNVGGLVASTLDLRDASLNGNARTFSGSGTGSVVNQGSITAANGGYVALLGNHVSNQGTISAQQGAVALGAGNAVTLTFSGNSLLQLQVDQSVLNSAAENGGLIRADGGRVIMSAGAKDALLASVVNNTGVIEARTVENQGGTITLLGGMAAGTVNVGGTLDASAPAGGNGGFIETSAANVKVANNTKITTAAAIGLAGTWLIDPTDFTIAPSGGDQTGATLSTALGLGNVTISSASGAGGTSGNVNVDDTVTWSGHKLTLNASNDVNINATMTASGSASLDLEPGSGNVNVAVGSSAFNGRVNFSGSGVLTMNNHVYTVINSLGTATSSGDGSLQGTLGNLAGYYALGSDINAAATSAWNSGAGFTPIGGNGVTVLTPAQEFSGVFDGLGHTVSGLTINRGSVVGVGMIGATGAAGVVRNLGLLGGSVAVTSSNYTGALVGQNFGKINNSFSTATVSASSNATFIGGLVGENSGGTINRSHAGGTLNAGAAANNVGGLLGGMQGGTVSYSYATGNVTGTSNYVGGLIGYSYGGGSATSVISNSYATGSVSGSSYVGGLLGANYGFSGPSTISNSYATGAVAGTSAVGGLVGHNYGGAGGNPAISNSYATGSVTGTAGASFVGGLVGNNAGAGALGGTVTNSYSTGGVSAGAGSTSVGGLIGNNAGTVTGSFWDKTSSGQATSAAGTGMTTANMQNQANFTSSTAANGNLNPAWDFSSTWVISGGYPLLLSGMTALTVTANNATSIFNGAAYGSNNGVTYTGLNGYRYSGTPVGVLGSITYGGTSQAALNAGTYTITASGLSSTGQQGYVVTYVNGALTINPLALIGTLGAGSSVYGSALLPGTVIFTNMIAGHVVTAAPVTVNTAGLTSSSGHLTAGTHTGIESVSGTLSGADAGNYTFAGTTGNYTVTPLALTGSIGTGSSTYGAVLVPGAASFTNAVSGDALGTATVGVNTTGLTSSSGHLIAGTHNGVETVSALSGADAGNYTFSGVTGDYTVNQLALNGTLAAGSSTYGSTLAPGAVNFTNALSGDLVTPGAVTVNTTGLTSSSGHLIAGTHTGIESVSGTLSGADAGNYTFAGTTGNYTVTPLALTGSIGTGSSTYGAVLVPGAASFTNAVSGDALGTATVGVNTTGLTSSSGHLIAGTHNGVETVSALSGADAGNYTFSGVTGNYTVNQLALNATVGAGSSTYGSTLTPGAVNFTNALSGDLVTPGAVTVNTTGLTSSSGHLIAGTHTGIESVGTALGGTDAGNYTFAGATGDYTVSQLALNGTVAVGGSIYGAVLAPGAASFTNALSGDLVTPGAVTVNTAGLTSSSGHLTAGTHTGIESVGTALGGADAGNYTFAGATGNYTVTPLALTGSIGTGSSTYGATLVPGAASFTNAVSGDALGTATVGVNTTGLTSSSGHLTAGTHTGIQTVSALSGADAGNYTFSGVTGDYTVNQLALNGTLAAGSSTYGSTLAPGAVNFTNALSGDLVTPGAVTVNTTGLTSSSGHLIAGTHTGIESVSGTLSGADAGNYTFAGTTGNYTVTPLALTGSIGTGSSTYGAVLVPGAASFTNAVSGDALGTATVGVNTTGLTSSSGHLIAGTHNGVETVSALSGADAGNYTFSGVTGNYTVNQLALNATVGAGSSTYGSTLTPGAVNFTNALSGDLVTPGAVTVNTTGLTSSSGHLIAGTHTGIESVGTALGGTDAGNYTFAGATGDYTVSQLALNGTVAVGGSIYGAVLAPGAASFTNALSGDLVTPGAVTVNTAGLTSSSGHLTAGTHTGIESVGTALGGADAGNYTFAGATGNYTVTPLALTGSIGTGSSTYGATLVPGAASFTNAVSGDALGTATVGVNTTGLTSSSGHLIAGTHTGIESVSALSGADAGNYTFAAPTGDYTVSQLALTGSIGAGSSTYGSALTPGAASFTNAVTGDLLGTATVAINTTGLTSSSGHLNAGTHNGIESVSALSGADAGNYTFAGPTGNYTVSPLALAGSIAAGSSTYGAALAPGALSISNVISGDLVSAPGVSVNTAGLTSSSGHLTAGTHIGIESVNGVLGGADAGNYILGSISGDYTVNRQSVTVTASGVNKVYDASTSGSAILTGSGLIGGDKVSFTDTSANFGDKNAGTGKTLTVSGIGAGGADAGNYLLSNATASTTADITPLAITVAAIGANKTYDGNTTAVVTLSGGLAGDAVTFSDTSANFADKNAGAGKTVTVAGISASGADAGNYTVSATTTTSANITPATLTYTAAPASSIAGQTPSGLSGTLSGLLGGDTLGDATTGSLAWTTNAQPTSQPGLYAIDGGGLSAMNYVFVQAAGNATALTLKPGAAPVTVQNVITALDSVFDPSHAGVNLAALDLVQFNIQPPNNKIGDGMNGVEVKITGGGVKLPDNIVSTDE
ncbi:filamentous hemagglutinin family protein [Collimonas sp. PA-H2]|uniref:YDG domain-containing protein n=1 Tax=Collimonas sp. PA-H2 TaxID=1881062 RepID=UPI000BF70B2D|nr:YDG domain-containing protein [Collimonas sp. PA-H2]PFH12288.1 filamentous hemagglutinin family protein [Collimonas sp. PA-H2]